MKENTPPEIDQELVRGAACGDPAAFEAIVRRYGRPLAEFAAGRTNTVQDAEDIVQETFLRAFVNLNAFDDRYSLKSWLFTIAYRLVVSGYRKKRLRLLDSDAFVSMADKKTDAPPAMDWLWEAAAEMGTDIHTVLWLRYKQELNIGDIATVMRKTKVGVRVLLHRARRRLAERIETRAANDPLGDWAQCLPVFTERTETK